jgi:hypothetical protein
MKKIISAIFGLALGLFTGLLIIGTVIRLIFSLVFGWGDSAPMWGVCVEAAVIVVTTIFTTYHTMRWSLNISPRAKENREA